MTDDEALRADVLRLAELNRDIVKAVVEGRYDRLSSSLNEYLDLRKGVQRRLLDRSVVVIENDMAADVLRKIAAGEGLTADKVASKIAGLAGEPQELHEFEMGELEDMGEELFHSWISHVDYVRGLAELRPLVLSAKTSESVSRLVEQARRSYAFQQYDAASALCRMLVEASVRDICDRYGLFADLGSNVVSMEKYTWRQLRDKVSVAELNDWLKDVYCELSKVVHGRLSVTQDKARRDFEEVMRVIEALYSHNECRFGRGKGG